MTNWRVLSTVPQLVYGAVVQLGERIYGIDEVVGSTPISSTRFV